MPTRIIKLERFWGGRKRHIAEVEPEEGAQKGQEQRVALRPRREETASQRRQEEKIPREKRFKGNHRPV